MSIGGLSIARNTFLGSPASSWKKSTVTEPPQKETKEEGVISCDAITTKADRLHTVADEKLKFKIESVYFTKADSHVSIYELFILWLKQYIDNDEPHFT
jgi:hypothetical protein